MLKNRSPESQFLALACVGICLGLKGIERLRKADTGRGRVGPSVGRLSAEKRPFMDQFHVSFRSGRHAVRETHSVGFFLPPIPNGGISKDSQNF